MTTCGIDSTSTKGEQHHAHYRAVHCVFFVLMVQNTFSANCNIIYHIVSNSGDKGKHYHLSSPLHMWQLQIIRQNTVEFSKCAEYNSFFSFYFPDRHIVLFWLFVAFYVMFTGEGSALVCYRDSKYNIHTFPFHYHCVSCGHMATFKK